MLAEDLLLILTDAETGRHLTDSTSLDYALAGALLFDLTSSGKALISDRSGMSRHGRIEVLDSASTGEPILDRAVDQAIKGRAKRLDSLIPDIAKGLRKELLAGLAAKGILREAKGKVLGIFPTTRWPAGYSLHEVQVRQGLNEVLVLDRTPSQEEKVLISILYAIGQAPKALQESGLDRRDLKRKAKAIARDEPIGKAVADAISAAAG